MMLLLVAAALAQVAMSGHVAVRMPFLNPAGITYVQGQAPYAGYAATGFDYQPHHHQQAYGEAQSHVSYSQAHYDGYSPVAYSAPQEQYVGYAGEEHGHSHGHSHGHGAVGYAQVPVHAAVAVPTVHHVHSVTDVPVTKIHEQPAVIQKIVEVAKPAIKTRKYQVRRPAIQKQFYDIEERVVVRPVGSALLELDEPIEKVQKGPAVVTSVDDHHHHHHEEVAYAAEHAIAVTAAPVHHAVAITPVPHGVAYAPTAHTVAITPSPHAYLHSTPEPSYAPVHYGHHESHGNALEHGHHYQEAVYDQGHAFVSSTPAPVHFSTIAPIVVTSTHEPHHLSDDSVVVEATARHVAEAEHAVYEAKLAHEDAVARAHHNAEHHIGVESHSNGSPHVVLDHSHDHVIHNHHDEHAAFNQYQQEESHHLNHLPNEEAKENQHKLLKLLTARGGVAEVGFGRSGHSEHVGDAGIVRAKVLSATPSPHHAPIDEKVNTRRIVVSRPVQTLQEIDVVEPVTKVEKVAVNHHTVIKTAQVGLQRVHTSVPVYGKALAPAIAHAQVPLEYYHHKK